MSRETELTAEMREDERERRRQRVRELREQRVRGAEPGDGLIRKSMGDDALPRTFEVPEGLKLFGDHRDEQLVSVLGMVISITRRQLRKEFAEELAERDPHFKKITALELEIAKLSGGIDVLRGAAPPPPAKFPKVQSWEAGVICYAGDIVTHEGSTWQARCDTAQAPQSWHVDKATYRATPVMSNGTLGPPLELRGLFEQFLLETQS